MRNKVIWAIRDARSLTQAEKMFLFVVESRGEMKTTWERAAEDMCMSKATFYKVRSALTDRGIILTQRLPHGVTIYKIDEESLRKTEESHTETRESHRYEQKKNTKKNSKKNITTEEELEEEQTAASAPVEIEDSIDQRDSTLTDFPLVKEIDSEPEAPKDDLEERRAIIEYNKNMALHQSQRKDRYVSEPW